MALQGGLRTGWGTSLRGLTGFTRPVFLTIIKAPDSFASSQSAPMGPRRMDSGKTLPGFAAGSLAPALPDSCQHVTLNSWQPRLPQQATAPNWSSLCILPVLVVGLLENVNCLSSGGLVTVKGVKPVNRMRKSISVKTSHWD